MAKATAQRMLLRLLPRAWTSLLVQLTSPARIILADKIKILGLSQLDEEDILSERRRTWYGREA